MKKIIWLFALSIVLVSCDKNKKVSMVFKSTIDPTVSPAEDFYKYVNGKWLDNTEIPEDRASWGAFLELRKRTDEDVMKILEEMMEQPNLDPKDDKAMAINLFKNVMNTKTRDELGVMQIQPFLDQIDQIQNFEDVQKITSDFGYYMGIGFWDIGVYPDAKDSKKNGLYLSNGSLGLPDREYYVSDSIDNKQKREKYTKHIAMMFHKYLGVDEKKAKIQAQDILNIETAISVLTLDRVESRDIANIYNPMSIEALSKLTPSINWKPYLDKIGATDVQQIIITELDYFKELEQIIKKYSISSWKLYLKWTLLRKTSAIQSLELEHDNWLFYGKELKGAEKERPLKERALMVVNGNIDEGLGKLYVEKKFPPQAKQKAEEIISYLMRAYVTRINKLKWMSEETKKQAIHKLEAMTIKVGYPNKWKGYEGLEVLSEEQGGNYFKNILRIDEWSFKRDIGKLKKPVDKEEWGMSPQTVNAYYNPLNNEIVFPAAILQFPFYNYELDSAVNFGGMGAVIGHEISHGFDDSGAKFDADGNFNNWWTEADLSEFKDIGKALADQYSALEPLPGIFVDGEFTLGENIGDLGGVCAAYDGLELYLKDNGRPEDIEGLTQEQRFFMSWARVWRTKSRDENIKSQVKTDPHTPGMYRAYVPLQNVDVFYEAFGIKENDKMYLVPEKRVKIW